MQLPKISFKNGNTANYQYSYLSFDQLEIVSCKDKVKQNSDSSFTNPANISTSPMLSFLIEISKDQSIFLIPPAWTGLANQPAFYEIITALY